MEYVIALIQIFIKACVSDRSWSKTFMAYDGEILDQCRTVEMDCSKVAVVAVSGAGPNVCGHMLIATGRDMEISCISMSRWFGAIQRYDRRRLSQIPERECQKRDVDVVLSLPAPSGAANYLEDMMSGTWTWGPLPNNCEAFVEEVGDRGWRRRMEFLFKLPGRGDFRFRRAAGQQDFSHNSKAKYTDSMESQGEPN
jgi:hypothetical protein